MNSPVWSDPNYLKLWMYCLMKATHKKREIIVGNAVVTLEPGQFITGRESLADDLNKGTKPKQRLSEKTWYRYIDNLEKWQMLTIKKTNKFSVISILNWSQYQENDHQMSIKSPSDVHRMSTNKNVKNVKNVEEDEDAQKNNDENPFLVYEQNFGLLKPLLQESFIAWCEDVGDDVMIAAMKLTVQKGGRTFGYIEQILREWTNAGLKNLDEIRAYEIEKKNRKNNTIPFKPRKTAGEIDWDNL